MGFLNFSKIFLIVVLFSWICELLLRLGYKMIRLWVGFMFVELGCLALVDFAFRLLDSLVIMFDFHP